MRFLYIVIVTSTIITGCTIASTEERSPLRKAIDEDDFTTINKLCQQNHESCGKELEYVIKEKDLDTIVKFIEQAELTGDYTTVTTLYKHASKTTREGILQKVEFSQDAIWDAIASCELVHLPESFVDLLDRIEKPKDQESAIKNVINDLSPEQLVDCISPLLAAIKGNESLDDSLGELMAQKAFSKGIVKENAALKEFLLSHPAVTSTFYADLLFTSARTGVTNNPTFEWLLAAADKADLLAVTRKEDYWQKTELRAVIAEALSKAKPEGTRHGIIQKMEKISGVVSGPVDVPTFDYKELFQPSTHLIELIDTDIVALLSQVVQGHERHFYHWLLSHFPILSMIRMNAIELLSPDLRDNLGLPRITTPGSGVDERIRYDMFVKVYEHLMQQLLRMNDMSPEQYSEALNTWAEKHNRKFAAFQELTTQLKGTFTGEELKILIYELAYFLNLLPFETSFETLNAHRQRDKRYLEIVTNTLGDSLLDGGNSLAKFYGQFETAVESIGYLPKDLQTFEGTPSYVISGFMRDTIGELLSTKDYDMTQRRFVMQMWRATCTLHLTAIFLHFIRESIWQQNSAPTLYQAIEEGSREVFDSGYNVYKHADFVQGHDMLVEIERKGTDGTEALYRIRQFNSGDGVPKNHKAWEENVPSNRARYLSFVDMPEVNETQIRTTGYYYAKGDSDSGMIQKLYSNKHLNHDNIYTDPLLYEKPQQGGTCAVSSKMFYFRSFGLPGRLLEIDFKVALIKQLLIRINQVQESKLSRTALLKLMQAEGDAQLESNEEEVNEIRDLRKRLFENVNMQEADQYIFLFPGMFTSLISSALNEILVSLYWIIDNDRIDIARELFEHFLKEIQPIFAVKLPGSSEEILETPFESENLYIMKILDEISPLIHDIHQRKGFRDIELPFKIFQKHVQMPKGEESTISERMEEIRKACLPFSQDKLQNCFHHIINAILDSPNEPELAFITSELSDKIDFDTVPTELSYLLLDVMRTTYGADFLLGKRCMTQIAFAPKLNWDYHVPEGTSEQDCDDYDYDYDDILTDDFDKLARCIYLNNEHGPIKYDPFLKEIAELNFYCNKLTEERLPTCFYHFITFLRKHSEAPELASITANMQKQFDFTKTPPALAYLIFDAMRSVYGKGFLHNYQQILQVAFLLQMPSSYGGAEDLVKDCEMVTDESIMKDWQWVAACRYKMNGPLFDLLG